MGFFFPLHTRSCSDVIRPKVQSCNALFGDKMKIYKDVFSGDELFSDTYKMSLVKDCLYEVVGKYETRKGDEVVLEGSNASAEEADEGTEEGSVSGVDVVMNHQLVETGFGSKKDFTVYLKEYMKKVVKDLQFFTGESMDPDAMISMCLYKEVNGEERPVLMFFKHGLREEKC